MLSHSRVPMKKLPTAFAFLLVLALSLSLSPIVRTQAHWSAEQEARRPLQELVTSCAKEHHVSVDALRDQRSQMAQSAKRNIKCAFQCLLEKSGSLDRNGKFDAASFQDAYNLIDRSLLDGVLKQCGEVKEREPCDYAYQIGRILLQNKVKI